MRKELRRTAFGSGSLITEADFRLYAKAVDISSENDMVLRMLESATQWVEQYIGQSINENTYELSIFDVDADRDTDYGSIVLELPMKGFASEPSSISVIGYDNQGAATTLTASSDYYVLQGGRIRFFNVYDSWKITFTQYGDPVPEPVIEAIYKLAAEMYNQRESTVTGTIVSNLKYDIPTFLGPYRRILNW